MDEYDEVRRGLVDAEVAAAHAQRDLEVVREQLAQQAEIMERLRVALANALLSLAKNVRGAA